MRLKRTQKVVSVTASLALAAWAGADWLGFGERPSGATAAPFALRPEFKLEDAAGRAVTQDDFQGKFLLVLFGFTNCREVCPTTLSDVGDVVDALGERADQVQPLFISVDPERDGVSDLARYTATFHSSILGLTGTPGAIRVAAENFHVFYDRHKDSTAPDDYTMEHSSSIFLLGPEGSWLRAFPAGTPATTISNDLLSRLE